MRILRFQPNQQRRTTALNKIVSTFSLFTQLSSKRRLQLLFVCGLSILSAICEVLMLLLVTVLFSLISNPTGYLDVPFLRNISLLTISSSREYVLWFGALLLSFVFLANLLRLITLSYQYRVSAFIISDISVSAFKNILSTPYESFLARHSSESLSIITNDMNRVSTAIQSGLTIMVNTFLIALISSYLFLIYPIITVVVIGFCACYFYVIHLYTRGALLKIGDRLNSSYEQSLQVAQESFNAFQEICLTDARSFFVAEFSKQVNTFRLSGALINAKTQSPRFFIEFALLASLVIVAISVLIYPGNHSALFVAVSTLVLALYRILQPLNQCVNSFGFLVSSLPSLSKVSQINNSLIESKQVEPDSPDSSYLNTIHIRNETSPSIVFENVKYSFRKKDGSLVGHSFDHSIEPNEKIGLIGASGSGKTTFLNLLSGLLSPQSGRILVNGSCLTDSHLCIKRWQKEISYVTQTPVLRNCSIGANVANGYPHDLYHSDDRIWRSLKMACADEFVKGLPDGLNTVLTEYGRNLSGGQRQRLALARALYRDFSLLLLDEATSAVDKYTESKIFDNIMSSFGHITLIVVSHSPTVQDRMNRKIYLHGESLPLSKQSPY